LRDEFARREAFAMARFVIAHRIASAHVAAFARRTGVRFQ
jgi:hypothetical protein